MTVMKNLFWVTIGLCVVCSIQTKGRVSAIEAGDGRIEEGNNRYHDSIHRSLRGSTNKDISSSNRKLNILTLGGSVTWGACISNREDAYPFLLSSLSSHSVQNLAIRATDSFFPSLCIQSMMAEAQLLNEEFDVIVLEYSLNGSNGLTTLVKRLQYRYPDAVFIYVHLVSLGVVAARPDKEQAGEVNENSHNINTWRWKEPRSNYEPLFHLKPQLQAFLEQVGAYVYTLPRDTNTNWLIPESSYFCTDAHHLGEKGHLKVATDLLTLLELARFRSDPATAATPHLQELLHTWGEGDMCSDWLLSGKLSNPNILPLSIAQPPDLSDPIMREIPYSAKYTLEFFTTGTITIRNTRNHPLEIYICFMAGKFENRSVPTKYPLTTVTNINDNGQSFVLNPTDSKNRASDGKMNKNHVRDMIQIGLAQPGDNVIRIEPMGNPGENNNLPFRLVGVALIGSAYNIGVPLRKPHNTLLINTGHPDEVEKR